MHRSYPKGTVLLIDLEPTEGSEQGGIRPCIVVNNLEELGLLIVTPLTSKEKKYHKYKVELEKGEGGLHKKSYVLCYHIRTVSVERVKKVIGKLPKIKLYEILSVIERMFGRERG